MNCEQARNELLLHQSGELESDRQAALQSHLAGCPECRRFSADSESLADAARQALRSGAPAHETMADIKLRARSFIAAQPGPAASLPSGWTPLRKLALAASIAVALGSAAWMLGVLLLPAPGEKTAETPTANHAPDQALARAERAALAPGRTAEAQTAIAREQNAMPVGDGSDLMLTLLYDELFSIEELRVNDRDAKLNALEREMLILYGWAI